MTTFRDIQNIESALRWLGNQKLGQGIKAKDYNALNLRLNFALEAYASLIKSLDAAQQRIFARYQTEAGDDFKPLNDERMTFGRFRDVRYKEEIAELLDSPVEGEIPKRKPFKLSEFDAVGIAVPQLVMEQLGALLEKDETPDPDAITE